MVLCSSRDPYDLRKIVFRRGRLEDHATHMVGLAITLIYALLARIHNVL